MSRLLFLAPWRLCARIIFVVSGLEIPNSKFAIRKVLMIELRNRRITGGAGFLGSHVVERLHQQGADVFVPRGGRSTGTDPQVNSLVWLSGKRS
jgi:hypothetical protein